MILLENSFSQQYFSAVAQTSRHPTQPGGRPPLTAHEPPGHLSSGAGMHIATGTVAPLFKPVTLICYLHSRNFPHSENGTATRRSCVGRNCGMQIGKGVWGKTDVNLQFAANALRWC